MCVSVLASPSVCVCVVCVCVCVFECLHQTVCVYMVCVCVRGVCVRGVCVFGGGGGVCAALCYDPIHTLVRMDGRNANTMCERVGLRPAETSTLRDTRGRFRF